MIINAGDAYTAWSGAENWTDEKVVTAIRRFVDQGRRIYRRGEPTACQYEGRYFQLSDVLGPTEMGFSMSTDKYNELSPKYRDHFILEDIKGEIDFGEGKNRIYAQGANYEILRYGWRVQQADCKQLWERTQRLLHRSSISRPRTAESS